MSAKRFHYEGQEWEAVSDGLGVGASIGSNYIPEATQWSVTFRCISDQKRDQVRGSIGNSSIWAISEDELGRSLRAALARKVGREH